jgi:hypothetical protein
LLGSEWGSLVWNSPFELYPWNFRGTLSDKSAHSGTFIATRDKLVALNSFFIQISKKFDPKWLKKRKTNYKNCNLHDGPPKRNFDKKKLVLKWSFYSFLTEFQNCQFELSTMGRNEKILTKKFFEFSTDFSVNFMKFYFIQIILWNLVKDFLLKNG